MGFILARSSFDRLIVARNRATEIRESTKLILFRHVGPVHRSQATSGRCLNETMHEREFQHRGCWLHVSRTKRTQMAVNRLEIAAFKGTVDNAHSGSTPYHCKQEIWCTVFNRCAALSSLYRGFNIAPRALRPAFSIVLVHRFYSGVHPDLLSAIKANAQTGFHKGILGSIRVVV